MNNSVESGANEHLAGGGVELTDEESQTLRRARLAKSAGTAVGQGDIVAELPKLTRREMAHIHHRLKLRAGAPTASVARAIRSTLARADDERTGWILHDTFHGPVLATANTAGLNEPDLAALLSADEDELGRVLESLIDAGLYDSLLDIENFGSTGEVRAATWSSMAAVGHSGSAAALAWLIADPPAFWGKAQTQRAQEVWVSLRERYPLLPETPAPIAALIDVVSTLDLDELDELEAAAEDGEVPGAAVIDAMTQTMAELSEHLLPATAAAPLVNAGIDDLAEIATELDRIETERLDIATGLVPALAEAVEIGVPVDSSDIARLARFFVSLSALLTAAVTLNDGQPVPNLSEAGAVLERAHTSAAEQHAAAGRTRQLRRLEHLTGPDFLAGDIGQVRTLAAQLTGDSDPDTVAGLSALVELIELAGSDPQRAAKLGRTVTVHVPAAISLLMFTSTPGTFTLPNAAAEPAAPAASDETLAGPQETTETEAATGSKPEQAADEETAPPAATGEPSDPTRQAALGAAQDTIAESEPAVTEEVAAATPAEQLEPALEDVLAQLQLTVPQPSPARTIQPAPAAAAAAQSTPPAPAAAAGPDPVALYSELLRSGELPLTYWMTVAQQADPAVQVAHRLAAHAAAIKTSAGSNAAAFAEIVTNLNPDELKDRPGTQMLLYGAGVRAGLLSPVAGAADPMRDATSSIVRTGPAVGELTEALRTAIYSGVYLTPRSADAVAEAAEVESEQDALAAAARALLDTAGSRFVKYTPAVEMWQMWMTPETGFLGKPLSIVASGSLSPVDLAFVRERVADLRSVRVLEQAVNHDIQPGRGTGKRGGKKIDSWAKDKLFGWIGDVTELLTEWVTTAEHLAPAGDGTWMSDPIADLRAKVAAVRDQALAELSQLCDTGREARDAATDAGLALLNDALDLLMGTASISGPEIPADRMLGGHLTLAPDLQLSPTVIPQRSITDEDVATAFAALQAGDDGWRAAFDARAARHDQVGTHLLIETLRPLRPQLAHRLSAVRDEAVDASIAQVETQAGALAAQTDSDRLFGRLTVDQWTDLSTRARAYQPGHRGTRSDFDVMLNDLAAIEQERAEKVKAAITTAREKLDAAGIRAADLERIVRRIDNGDLTTAAEYEVTVRSGGQLPDSRQYIDHLARFKVFPDAFAATRPGVGAGAHPLLQQLRSTLEAQPEGSGVPAGQLADVLAAAGIDLGRVGRGTTSATRIEQWTLLGRARSFDARINNVKSVLEQVGFVFDKSTNPPARPGNSGRGSWLDLHAVRATSGKALLPAFGSGMSPSGDTLRLLGVWRGPTPAELVEMLRDEPTDQSIIVLYFGTLDSAARRELARMFRNDRRLPTTIVVDDAAFAYLSCQPENSREITMSALLPFTSSSPFTPDVPGASIRQEMFYGRGDERTKIIDMMGPCIVYGGRQLGKSALLLEAARKFNHGGNRHAIVESIFKIGRAAPVDAVWTTLWPLLAAKDIVPPDIPAGNVAAALTAEVKKWVDARPGRQLLLLLDESDKFLDGDAEAVDGMFTNVTHFKELMERTGRAAKVVFAGLHQTARFDRLANHPLAHFGEPVCVGPLAPQAAFDLLTRPLQALGYRFDESDHAARVLALANNQPALIQLFAAQLLRNLQAAPMPDDAPPQTIHAEDVERVWADPTLRTSFRKRFDWTLDLDPRYKVIAYSVALHAHARGIDTTMTPAELRTECETWWPAGFAAEDVRTGEFRALLDECVDLGVLSYTNRGYRLRTPNVLDLLGTSEEVDAVLDQAESIELPESFDSSLMRPRFSGGPTRGPLTSQQIADLLAARNQVRLIVGSAALTVERSLKALQDENEHAVSGHRESVLREATPPTLANVCQQAAFKAAGRHAIVVVDLKNVTAQTAHATWAHARDLIATHAGGTLGIVLISTPTQAAMWPAAVREADTSSGLTELRRYDRADLRLWLTETTLPFQDTAARDDLLAVTGGWPFQVNKVAQLDGRDMSLYPDPLVEVRISLVNDADAQALLKASGARTDATLSQAWDFLVRTVADEPTDLQTLVDLLVIGGDSGEPGSDALTPDAMTAAGYVDAADVLDVLRMLRLVVGAAEDGQVELEPVMVAATRRVHG